MYTGEGADGGGCPKGAERLGLAERWSAKHPFPAVP